MSYIKNIPIKKTVSSCINYIANEEKNDGFYIGDSGIDWHMAASEWEQIRKKYNKNSGILAHHFVQSFNPDHGMSPEEANRIGMELAQKQFGKLGFDFIVSTHLDTLRFDKDGNQLSGLIYDPFTMTEMYDYKGNRIPDEEIKYKEGEKVGGAIHNHILVNNVSRTTGRKYNHDKKTYRYLRQLNIDVCRNNGIPAVDSPSLEEVNTDEMEINLSSKYKSKPYIKTHAYDSWSQKQSTNLTVVRKDINTMIKKSISWEDFISNMEGIGYRVDWKTLNGEEKKFITYFPPNAERGRRDRSLGMQWFSKEAIIERIEKVKGENQISYKKKPVQIKKVSISRKKYKYYLNPEWDARPLYFGKSRYRRRSWWESLIIKTFYAKRIEIESFENKNSTRNTSNLRQYENAKKEIEETMSVFKIIQENGIKRSEDIVALKKDLEFEIYMEKGEQENIKTSLLNVDNLIENIIILEKYEDIFNEYHARTGKEKENFYYANKNSIQQYVIANRNIEKSDLKDCSKEEMTILQNNLQENIAKIDAEIKKNENKLLSINVAKIYVEELERREFEKTLKATIRKQQENKAR